MTDTQGLYACLLVAAAICVWCLRRAVTEYRAEVPTPSPSTARCGSRTRRCGPRHTTGSLRRRAELDDDEAVARWIEATS